MIAEGLGDWLLMEPRSYTVEQGLRILMDTFRHGFAPAGGEPAPPCAGTVEDAQGVATRLEALRVDGCPYLAGRKGEARVELPLARLASIRIRRRGSGHVGDVTTREGEHLEIELDGEKLLSGAATFGSFQIPLERVVRIRLEEG